MDLTIPAKRKLLISMKNPRFGVDAIPPNTMPPAKTLKNIKNLLTIGDTTLQGVILLAIPVKLRQNLENPLDAIGTIQAGNLLVTKGTLQNSEKYTRGDATVVEDLKIPKTRNLLQDGKAGNGCASGTKL